MYKSFSMELAGRTLTVDIGRVCAQANGAALIKYGETTVLSTAVSIRQAKGWSRFLPIKRRVRGENVRSQERYRVDSIREKEKHLRMQSLTSRVIDRPMSPLFPKDYQ